MEEIYLGIELNDESCSLFWLNSEENSIQILSDEEGNTLIPSFLCLDTIENCWYAGAAAEEAMGRAGCLVFNRVVSLFRSGQALKRDDQCWNSEEIFGEFLRFVLDEAKKRSGNPMIGNLVVCMEDTCVQEAEIVKRLLVELGIEQSRVHVFDRLECFMYYMMSQKRELWSNVSYLFDYEKEGLFCYELDFLKGLHPVSAHAKKERIENAPEAELVTEGMPDDKDRADSWFAELAEKKLTGKIVNSVFLCGEGFSDWSWAKQFIKKIRLQKGRKLYQVDSFFGRGAAYAAYHIADHHRQFPYICICKGRVSTSISLYVDQREGSEQLILIQTGTSCSEAKASVDLNLIDQSELDLYVRNTGASESYRISLDLSAFMEDGRDRTKIRLSIAFADEENMMVRIEDLGFGEIFPSTGQIVTRTYQV